MTGLQNDWATAEPGDGSISVCFKRLKSGDQAAADDVCRHFLPRLHALARDKLNGSSQRIADADDAVQSALVTFWRRAVDGQFRQARNRHDLWQLLAKITTRKACKHLERESAQKRGHGRVQVLSELPGSDTCPESQQVLANAPAGLLDACCDEWLALLDEESCRIALLRLMGFENSEISHELQCSLSKVERKLRLIRKRWQIELDKDQ